MPKIEITPTHLKVKLSPAEKFFGLHGDLEIPGVLIRGAEVANKDVWKTLGLRIPGTGIPSMLAYGSFWQRAGWTFSIWRSNSPAVEITLATGPKNRYKRLVLAAENPTELADQINNAIVSC